MNRLSDKWINGQEEKKTFWTCAKCGKKNETYVLLCRCIGQPNKKKVANDND